MTDGDMRQQLSRYSGALTSFSSSPSKFHILHSLPTSTPPPPKTLYILDSSFNPPTLAHARIATSALLHDTHSSPSPKRLLLLLAIQNADKAPKPASFEQRLAMMQAFASDLLASISKEIQNSEDISIDIAVTKLPYFVDKSATIEESGAYSKDRKQVHMIGFDTLIRILDPKYYGPMHSLEVLDPFFRKNRLRVTYRTDDEWGSRKAQDNYLREIADGKRNGDGAHSEWVTDGMIEMCEGRKKGEDIVSSTKVREAAKKEDRSTLERLVTPGVADWVLSEGLYQK
ncbi:hypothetical protein BJ878DRAFT_121302 [Calycina marina]|uniref:Nicotinamide-nucleotide adenylyltransferase n=1 Tax=Calycina marina TaxID=1763456 RepID=A0A9P7Z1T8_9HELO|nr:hypothetical protein BJ878DRAFT_121302 [Calycina marina]